jgi:hypothetical protein
MGLRAANGQHNGSCQDEKRLQMRRFGVDRRWATAMGRLLVNLDNLTSGRYAPKGTSGQAEAMIAATVANRPCSEDDGCSAELLGEADE